MFCAQADKNTFRVLYGRQKVHHYGAPWSQYVAVQYQVLTRIAHAGPLRNDRNSDKPQKAGGGGVASTKDKTESTKQLAA